ncbi:MAG: hypothetical protein ACLR8Y_08155 [Alistipes indistinctus]
MVARCRGSDRRDGRVQAKIDAWTRLIWLCGEGRSGTDSLGFRYRKQGDTPWITVPGDKVEVSGRRVSKPASTGLEPERRLTRLVAYSGEAEIRGRDRDHPGRDPAC